MKLSITRHTLQITPEDKGYPTPDERDTAFIESVLGLKKEGDSIKLIRKDASGLSHCIAYLETDNQQIYDSDAIYL